MSAANMAEPITMPFRGAWAQTTTEVGTLITPQEGNFLKSLSGQAQNSQQSTFSILLARVSCDVPVATSLTQCLHFTASCTTSCTITLSVYKQLYNGLYNGL